MFSSRQVSSTVFRVDNLPSRSMESSTLLGGLDYMGGLEVSAQPQVVIVK